MTMGSSARGLLAVVLIGIAVPAVAQPRTKSYQDPIGRFTLQYPQRDWIVFPGAGSVLVTIAEKNAKATVHVDYQFLNQPLSVDESRDLIVQIESDLIRQRQPKSDRIQPVATTAIPAAVVIDYVRPGVQGLERVRQFSLVRGQDLYRVLCVTPAAETAKFDAVFDQIARSFNSSAAATRQGK
jgi:hypothetical protein